MHDNCTISVTLKESGWPGVEQVAHVDSECVQTANPLLWVVDKRLACAPRPLRYDQRFGGVFRYFRQKLLRLYVNGLNRENSWHWNHRRSRDARRDEEILISCCTAT